MFDSNTNHWALDSVISDVEHGICTEHKGAAFVYAMDRSLTREATTPQG